MCRETERGDLETSFHLMPIIWRMPARQITIRKMVQEDMDAVMAILAAWNMAPRPPSPALPTPEREGINIPHTFVAVDENSIVGVCSYIVHSETEAETASMAVRPDYIGSRAAVALQRARLEEMRARGIKRIRTESDRPRTIEWLMKRFGFRIVGTHKKLHDFSLSDVDCWTVLELDL